MGSSRAPSSRRPGRWRHVTAAAIGFAAALATATSSGAQDLGFTASVFGARTAVAGASFDGVYVFNSLDVGRGPVRATFSVPWIRSHSRTDATTSPIDGSEVPAADATATGFGDPLLRVDVRVVNQPAGALQVGLAGAAKFPAVAAETGRGTGEFDGAVGVSAYKGLGRVSLLLDAMYWAYGDPETVDFENSLSYSFAVARALGSSVRWSTMVSLSGFSGSYDGLSPPVMVNVAMLRLLGRRQSLSVSASIGLTESATDFSIGTSWRVTK